VSDLFDVDYSLFSTLFGTHIPGAIYLSQSIKFTAPVYVGDTVTARITVSGIVGNGRSQRVVCNTRVYNDTTTQTKKQSTTTATSEPVIVVDGEATVKVPNLLVTSTTEATSSTK
jgi:acyl dehydratase